MALPVAAGGISSGSSMLKNILLKAPNANITRPTVAMPDKADYGSPGQRPTITMPNRPDFGGGSVESKLYMKEAGKTAHNALTGFNNPTGTAAFQNLMNLAQEQTGSAEAEISRHAKDAAARAGYTGGFQTAAKQASYDRLHALAEAGFGGAAQIRSEQLGLYNQAHGDLTSLVNSYNQAQNASNIAYGQALAGAHEAQGNLDLGFSKLVQEGNLSYADAKGEAQRLQAQLDSAYNNQLIDNAKYTQMSASLAAQLESERMRLAQQKEQFNLTRNDSLLEAARLRKERGVDPVTGKKYGAGNYDPKHGVYDVL